MRGKYLDSRMMKELHESHADTSQVEQQMCPSMMAIRISAIRVNLS